MMLAKMQLIGYVGSERYLDRAGRVEWRFNSMIGKITKVSVERLGANQMLWDSGLVGFGARRQRRHVHYLLRYRLNGTQRFHSIGRHGMWTPDSARTEAKRLLGLV